ncbi:methylmalonyl Co-A mutase-associated GTPase MeaB [Acidobacteriota bacterium]
MNLTEEILKGNPRAVAKGISLVENDPRGSRKMMKELFPHSGGSLIVGITGAPGSGKSTLVDQLIGRVTQDKKSVGIIAVDPSSPFSGGAILGDRIRMMRHSENPNVFIRSMATRGHLGGLTKATGEAISILEASGKEFILIETVGVGQDEVEVVKMADVIIVVLMPGAGDDIQAFKAGIMEIADVFVINKADSSETDKTERQLRAMLDLGFKDRATPDIVRTVATKGEGIEDLYRSMLAFLSSSGDSNRIGRKKRLIAWMLKDIINTQITRQLENHLDPAEFDSLVEQIFRREIDPYSVADRIISKLTRI